MLTDAIIRSLKEQSIFLLFTWNAKVWWAEKGTIISGIRKQLASFDFIGGPVHINKNHKALLFINVKTQNVLDIDSKGINHDTVLLNLRYFCKNHELMKDIENDTATIKLLSWITIIVTMAFCHLFFKLFLITKIYYNNYYYNTIIITIIL